MTVTKTQARRIAEVFTRLFLGDLEALIKVEGDVIVKGNLQVAIHQVCPTAQGNTTLDILEKVASERADVATVLEVLTSSTVSSAIMQKFTDNVLRMNLEVDPEIFLRATP